MTLSQWKTIGAATLACVLAMGGLRAFAQFGGIGAGEKAPGAEPVEDDRQAALSQAVSKIQAELDEANRRNAELQTQLQAIQAELKTLRAGQVQAPAKEAKSKVSPTSKTTRPRIRDMGFGGPGGRLQESSTGQYKYYTQNNVVLVVPPLGGTVKVHNTRTNKTQSFQLSSSKELPIDVAPVLGPNVTALSLRGSNLTGIAASYSFDGPWMMQKLREPIDGTVSPIVGPDIAVYTLGRYLYGFSPRLLRWDVVEMPKEAERIPTISPGNASLENDDHVYTFDAYVTGKWSDVDLRAIIDAPDDNAPNNAKPIQPRIQPTPGATTR